MSLGSITKEFPLASLDTTILAITPGTTYEELRQFARNNTNTAIPAILRNRFLLVNSSGAIEYDVFLSLVNSEGIDTPRLRKIMYFVWAFRDERIRRFICEVVASSTGLWRPNQISRKANAKFFEEFFEEKTAPKVRSNIERFFVETGIFNPQTKTVHLELQDGWLLDALRVSAQHERNAAWRRSMVNAPYDFLNSRGWHALANATHDTLCEMAGTVVTEEEPLIDDEIAADPAKRSNSKTWNRRPPNPARRTIATSTVDLVALERANTAHYLLEKIFAQAVRNQGFDPQQNEQIDMHFSAADGTILAEMKSCHENNLHSQVRRGISQLLEYRYLYQDIFDDNVILVLILEIEPPAVKHWLIDYAASLGIILAWKQIGDDNIVSTTALPAVLDGIILPVN